MKDKTKVKNKNVWKVAEVLADDPNATIRQIAEEAWLAKNTVLKGKKELRQNWDKDPIIQYIVKSSKERIKRAQLLFDRFIDEAECKDKLDRKDASLVKEIIKDDMQRVTVFGGNVTDEWWWLNKVSELDLLD